MLQPSCPGPPPMRSRSAVAHDSSCYIRYASDMHLCHHQALEDYLMSNDQPSHAGPSHPHISDLQSSSHRSDSSMPQHWLQPNDGQWPFLSTRHVVDVSSVLRIPLGRAAISIGRQMRRSIFTIHHWPILFPTNGYALDAIPKRYVGIRT